MGTSNYSDEFKRDAVQQITVRGYPVREVSRRLGVSSHSLYKWLRLFADPAPKVGGMAQVGYKRRPGRYGGKPAVVTSNTLDRQFEVDAPDKVWGEPLKAPLVQAQWRATSPTSRPTKAGCIWRS
jgi:transposase-like protein